jgi:hypothetical protein
MQVKFSLPMQVFSVNRMNARDVRFKTAEYKAWANEVLYRLSELEEYKTLQEMASDHQAYGGTFAVKITAQYPYHIFYNKAGQISSKTIDCTNFGKPILDLVFGDTLSVNDKYVVKCTECKEVGPSYAIVIQIEYFKP